MADIKGDSSSRIKPRFSREVGRRLREGGINDLGTIIAALHDSEINGEVSWFFDGVWRVRLGDAMNGYDAEAVVSSASEAAEWLRANAVRRYPASEFAKLFPRSANDS